jgi:hypothetical protein
LINNRQNGRRRGRGGGQRPGGGGGQGQRDSGNRIDSRARGNAAQLLEKYRNMARDAQMSGDRVNTEYYLQFADHYFRVLADQRGRSDDSQAQRRPQRDDFDQFDMDDDFGTDFAGEGEPIRADEQPRVSENDGARRDRDERQPRFNARDRGERPERAERNDRAERQPRGNGHAPQPHDERFARPAPAANDVEDAPAPAAIEAEPSLPLADAQPEPPRRRGRPRKVREEDAADTFGADRLPPAIGAPVEGVPGVEGELADEAPKPRRRRTRAAAEATPAE